MDDLAQRMTATSLNDAFELDMSEARRAESKAFVAQRIAALEAQVAKLTEENAELTEANEELTAENEELSENAEELETQVLCAKDMCDWLFGSLGVDRELDLSDNILYCKGELTDLGYRIGYAIMDMNMPRSLSAASPVGSASAGSAAAGSPGSSKWTLYEVTGKAGDKLVLKVVNTHDKQIDCFKALFKLAEGPDLQGKKLLSAIVAWRKRNSQDKKHIFPFMDTRKKTLVISGYEIKPNKLYAAEGSWTLPRDKFIFPGEVVVQQGAAAASAAVPEDEEDIFTDVVVAGDTDNCAPIAAGGVRSLSALQQEWLAEKAAIQAEVGMPQP